MFKFILLFLFLTSCKTAELIENVKGDFALEKKATIYNKSSVSKDNIPTNGMIFVKKNETIFSIANEYKVIPKDIIEDNNLIKPYSLKENQILFLRNKNIYIIKQGDTLDKISLRFAVNKLDVISLNKLKQNHILKVGNKILIPVKRNYSLIDQIIDKKIYKVKPSKNKYKTNEAKKN